MRKELAFRISIALILSGVLSCSKQNLSERDQKLNQARAAAEAKRKELQVVAGEYFGTFTQASGTNQKTCLNLEIKDIPTNVEGLTEQINVPTLAGSLRFNYGDCQNSQTYISFGIDKSAFDATQDRLSLIVSNSEYKEMKLDLIRTEPNLKGTWEASTIGLKGTIELARGAAPSAQTLSGEYGGVFWRGKDFYQLGHLTLKTTSLPPDGIKIAATLRIIFGTFESSEYLTYRFEIVKMNPLTGQINIGEGTDIALVGNLSEGKILGLWSSKLGGTGELGPFDLVKDALPPAKPNQGQAFEPLGGFYGGKLNNNPGLHYPEQLEMNVIATQNLSKPNGLEISGNLKFIQGAVFTDFPFIEVRYDSFTKRFIGESVEVDGEKLTLDVLVDQKKVTGRLKSSRVGDVGTVEGEKP